jgi:hypothetical protein
LDKSLAEFVMNEAGIEFLYSYMPIRQELFATDKSIKKARIASDSLSRRQHKLISRLG